MLVAGGAAYVAIARRLVAPFRRHLTLPPHGRLVGSLLVGPPRVVFALALVVCALALVDLFLLDVAGSLLGIVRELPAPVRRALTLN